MNALDRREDYGLSVGLSECVWMCGLVMEMQFNIRISSQCAPSLLVKSLVENFYALH